MSGPKCSSYSVRRAQNELRRQARLRELRSLAEAAHDRLDQIIRQSNGAAAEIVSPAIPVGGSETALTDYAATATALAARVEARVARQALLRHLDSFGNSRSLSPEQVTSAPADPARDERKQRIADLLGRIREPVASDMAELRALADKLADCDDPVRSRRLESELQYAVQKANDGTASRTRHREAARALLDSLVGLDTAAARALKPTLEAAVAAGTALPQTVRAEVEAAARVAEKQLEEDYVAAVLRDELRKAGYEVPDEPFATTVAAQDQVIARDNLNPGYGVRVVLTPERRLFELAVVRFDDGGTSPQRARRDREVEDDFCERRQEMADGMRAAGVESTLIHRIPAGHQAVEVVRTGPARTRVDEESFETLRERSHLPRGDVP